MNIAQISKADSFGGGASRVAEDLNFLINKNHNLGHHFASWSGKGYGNSDRYSLYGRFDREIRYMHYLVKKIGFPELIPFELLSIIKRALIDKYDLFHFHDLSSAISPYTLSYIASKKPVIWTIHDCSPFTGGCLYPMDCIKFKSGCGNCPQIGEWPIDSKFDGTSFMYKIKKNLHLSNKITPITPSKWMSELAFSSGMFVKKPVVIPNGVDINNFTVKDKKQIRVKLNLPIDRKIILLSSGDILDHRKGNIFALEAIRQIKSLNPFIVVVGALSDEAKKIFSDLDCYATGYISNSSELADFYASADIFLFCSLADNQPLVVLETMASGTPIIGFSTGGISELVEQDKTGFLVEPKNIMRLVEAIKYAFNNNRHIQWSIESRRKAINEFSFDRFYQSHIDLYKSKVKNEL
jgi:glycosyltransferase involved in cell wall biosynthesis